MPKYSECKPAANIRMPSGVQSPSQGKQTGAVRPTCDAEQGPRSEQADPSPRKPAQ